MQTVRELLKLGVIWFIGTMIVALPVWGLWNWKVASLLKLDRAEPDQIFFLVVFVQLLSFAAVGSNGVMRRGE